MAAEHFKVNQAIIIDDDEISTFLFEYVMSQLGVAREIKTVANGKEAVDLYLSSTHTYPDFVILDINMPIMDGFEFLKWYEENGLKGKSKFVILTSSELASDIEKAGEYEDVIGYISKPLTKQKIEKIVLQVVGDESEAE